MGNEIQPTHGSQRVPARVQQGHRAYLQPPQNRGVPSRDLTEVWAFIVRRRWAILVTFVSVMIVVSVLTFIMPRTYVSSVSFLIERQDVGSGLPAFSVLERMGRSAGRETEVEIIQSRRVLGPVVQRLGLNLKVGTEQGRKEPTTVFSILEVSPDAQLGRYTLSRSPGGAMEVREQSSDRLLARAPDGQTVEFAGLSLALPSGSPGSPIRLEVIAFDEAIQNTQKRIDVGAVDRDADLVRLSCEGRTAEAAQFLCETVSESYLALRSELQRAEATTAAEFLSEQVERVESRLTAAEDSLQTYARRSGAVALGTRADERVRQSAELWAQREQLKAERAALRALLREVEGNVRGSRQYRDLASFPTFLTQDSRIVPKLVESLVDLETQRSDLAVRRSDSDVEVAAIDARISELEDQLHTIATGYERALSAQVSSLDDAIRNSGAALARIPIQQVESARLERQVSLLDDLYSFLQTRLREAEVAQAVQLPSMRVVDRASLPFEHTRPNEPLNVGLGLLLGLGSGLLFGLLREQTDNRVRERRTVEGDTGIPVLSMLPSMKQPGPIITVTLPGSSGGRALTLAPEWNAERAIALEAFRSLSAELGFAGRGLESGAFRSLAVTSSGRSEGKTLSACNLAVARASHGVRTLLVDGDLRARGVTSFFSLPGDAPGLANAMVDPRLDLDRCIQPLIVAGRNKLYVLPAGTATSHSAQFLESDRFRELVRKWERDFDFVVVDTPPLSLMTDAASIAAAVDATIVVVRAGTTGRDALDFTLERLQRAGARTTGIVLNDVRLPSHYRTYRYDV